jgi:DNA ligase (NAD+)
MISETGAVYIRGEAVIKIKDFKENLAGSFENPRNTVSGLIRGKKHPELLKHVTFVAYDYYGSKRGLTEETETQIIQHLQHLGFEVPRMCVTVSNEQEALEVYKNYDSSGRDLLPWMTDGLVMKLKFLYHQDRLGANNARPEHSVAIKPTPKACVTRVLSLTWEQGLSGRFTPVAQVEPTPLDGVTLRNVCMHNLDYLWEWARKGFGVGAVVTVIRSGDVIPYLTGIVAPAPN